MLGGRYRLCRSSCQITDSQLNTRAVAVVTQAEDGKGKERETFRIRMGRWKEEPVWNTGYLQFGYQMKRRRSVCAVDNLLDGGGGGTIAGFAVGACALLVRRRYVIFASLLLLFAISDRQNVVDVLHC